MYSTQKREHGEKSVYAERIKNTGTKKQREKMQTPADKRQKEQKLTRVQRCVSATRTPKKTLWEKAKHKRDQEQRNSRTQTHKNTITNTQKILTQIFTYTKIYTYTCIKRERETTVTTPGTLPNKCVSCVGSSNKPQRRCRDRAAAKVSQRCVCFDVARLQRPATIFPLFKQKESRETENGAQYRDNCAILPRRVAQTWNRGRRCGYLGQVAGTDFESSARL